MYEPRGQEIGFRESFCETVPWPIPPVGVDVPAGDISIQMSESSALERDVPFPLPRAGGSGRARASQGASPGYWCPLPTSGRRRSPMGQRAEKDHRPPVSLRGKASDTTYRPYFGIRSPFPLPSLAGYPTQQHICKGTTRSL